MSRGTDFLVKIQGQSDYNILPEKDRKEIDSIVALYEQHGMNDTLRRRIHSQLVRLGQNYAFLDTGQRKELLDAIRAERSSTALSRPGAGRVLILGCLAVVFAVILTVTAYSLQNRNPSPPPAGTIQQNQQKQIPVQNTALQQFQADWGPFQQITSNPDSDYLLLLQSGNTFQSHWVLPEDRQWAPDITGDIPSADIHGPYADITDQSGLPYTVRIGEPFVLAGNPQIILRVDPAGNVYYMSIAHGASIRVKK